MTLFLVLISVLSSHALAAPPGINLPAPSKPKAPAADIKAAPVPPAATSQAPSAIPAVSQPGSPPALSTGLSVASLGGPQVPPDDMLKLRDPFKRPDSELVKVGAKSELENYSLDAMKMTGFLSGPNHNRALLTADGKIFVVHKGMRIGTRGGVILKITPEKLVVREKVANVLGQLENLDSEIAMQVDAKAANGGKSK